MTWIEQKPIYEIFPQEGSPEWFRVSGDLGVGDATGGAVELWRWWRDLVLFSPLLGIFVMVLHYCPFPTVDTFVYWVCSHRWPQDFLTQPGLPLALSWPCSVPFLALVGNKLKRSRSVTQRTLRQLWFPSCCAATTAFWPAQRQTVT